MKQKVVRALAILSWIQCAALSVFGAPEGASSSNQVQSARVDFLRDIQPIFVERCYSCHGVEKQKNGLRLDSKERAFAGGDNGKAFVPGKSGESLLYRYVAGLHPEIRMPPKGEPLTTKQIVLIRNWIDAGAPWPEAVVIASNGQGSKSVVQHWSFQRPKRPPLPQVKNTRWVRNAIDAFVLARLEELQISPSAEADRPTLIRRLSLDLLGLPPLPEAVSSFISDQRGDAYERLVDSLLASPHFGERWGRHWLDLARYADSEGYQVDRARPWAYVYRNWVIDTFNRDMPFDQFTVEQLAGDLLPNATLEQRIATGFHRNTLMNLEDGVDREEFRCKAKADRVATTGTTWLGLTLGCAECHSHKYDPVTQKEFYQLYAFFDNAEEIDISAPQVEEKQVYAQRQKWYDETTARLKVMLAECRVRSPRDQVKYERALNRLSKSAPQYQDALAQALRPTTNLVKTFVHVRGDFLRHGDEVRPGVISSLNAFHPRGEAADRLDLARWLVDPANPLTSRVAVNRVWQHLFGRGLVATPEDFGARGELPSHPELLDWLATEFVRLGWSQKELIRLIVNSSTYRQSSHGRSELMQRDANNRWLARQNRFRVESEIIRDLYLSCGGLLNWEIKGPSFHPPVTDDFKALGSAGAFTWVETEGPEKYKRGMYVFTQRTVPYPISMTFDAANPNESCPRRETSDTPLQALTLLNNPTFVECAQALGRRMALAQGSIRERIGYGFEVCVGRKPSREEALRLQRLFEQERIAMGNDSKSVVAVFGDAETNGANPTDAAALGAVAQVLMNLDEFVTRE